MALFVTDKPVIVVPAALVSLGFMIYGLIELPRQSKVLRSEKFLYGVLFSFGIVIIVWRMLTVLG
jgi:formate/nitrite transporter FocA (FNT family)